MNTDYFNKWRIGLITLVSVFLIAMCFFALSSSSANSLETKVRADGEPAELRINYVNVSYGDMTYLFFYVQMTNVENPNNVTVLFFSSPEEGFEKGDEDYAVEYRRTQTVGDVLHYLYYSNGFAPKNLVDDVYCRAYAYIDGEAVYSNVVKYSLLKYLLRKIDTAANEVDENLYQSLLNYGAAAQLKFGYKTDTLATDTYYTVTVEDGTLDDGFTSGLYKAGSTVTVTADADPDGKVFSRWVDGEDNVLGTTRTLDITVDETITVTAEYLNATEGLAYTLNNAGTEYSVTGIGTATDTDIVIPSVHEGKPVTSIGYQAFKNCNKLTSLTISDSVNDISYSAFYNCYNLTNISLGNGVTNIGGVAFFACYGLTHIIIPKSVTSIEGQAFSYCRNLTSVFIPDNVTNINNAFLGCSGLTSITIGNGLTGINDSAFEGCSAITNITIPDCVTTIGKNAFRNCDNLTTISFGSGVSTVDSSAFEGCTNLSNIDVSVNNNNFKSIDGNLYSKDGAALIRYTIGKTDTTFTIPFGVTDICDYAFDECNMLTNITIPSSVTSIGYQAFANCWNLSSLNLPNSVTTIGERGIWRCQNLTNISIPESIESIGKNTFDGCSRLSNIEVSINNNNFKSIDGNLYSKDGSVLIRYTIGKTDTTFTIPSSVTHIGNYSFHECSNLTNITITSNVTSIGEYAFNNCNNLTSVTIPYSMTRIDEGAFWYCNSLTSVYYTGTIDSWCEIDFDTYNANPLKYAHNLYINNELVTEANITTATKISSAAFLGCSSLIRITISDSVSSIGDYAFCSCINLIGITIPNSVTTIGEYAFNGCSELSSIIIPDGITIIKEYTFNKCNGIQNVIMPDSVTRISRNAFNRCDNLTIVYYKGSADNMSEVSIDWYNYDFEEATHYYYSETEPTEEGNYWHYVDDEPAPW